MADPVKPVMDETCLWFFKPSICGPKRSADGINLGQCVKEPGCGYEPKTPYPTTKKGEGNELKSSS